MGVPFGQPVELDLMSDRLFRPVLALAAGNKNPSHLKKVGGSAVLARKTLEKAVGAQTLKGHSFLRRYRRAVPEREDRVGERWGNNF